VLKLDESIKQVVEDRLESLEAMREEAWRN